MGVLYLTKTIIAWPGLFQDNADWESIEEISDHGLSNLDFINPQDKIR